MTGMKEGAGDDPFADEEEKEATHGTERRDEPEPRSEATVATAEERGTSGTRAQGPRDIPYKFRRDGVMDGRSQMPVYLREEVQEREQEFIRQLEEELGEAVPKADAREAALIAAFRQPDQVAAVLREWGFDYDESG